MTSSTTEWLQDAVAALRTQADEALSVGDDTDRERVLFAVDAAGWLLRHLLADVEVAESAHGQALPGRDGRFAVEDRVSVIAHPNTDTVTVHGVDAPVSQRDALGLAAALVGAHRWNRVARWGVGHE